MTPEERKQLMHLIIATSAYYGHKIEDTVLALYIEDLEDLPLARIAQAIREVRRDPKTTRFPLPAVIRARLTPPETDEDQAREAASRILAAVARYGWSNPERAEAYIGELGWEVVKRQGGWRSVCEGVTEDNKTIHQAQWRDLAASLSRRSRAGTLEQAPALPSPVQPMANLLPEMPR